MHVLCFSILHRGICSEFALSNEVCHHTIPDLTTIWADSEEAPGADILSFDKVHEQNVTDN